MAVLLPEALVVGSSENAEMVEQEVQAHLEVYERADRIYRALSEGGFDAWLEPAELNAQSSSEAEYQLQDVTLQDDKKSRFTLVTKVAHQNRPIATLGEVGFEALREIKFTDMFGGKGVSLRVERSTMPTHPEALNSESRAFGFIDRVLKGVELEVIDLGLITSPEQEPTAAATA